MLRLTSMIKPACIFTALAFALLACASKSSPQPSPDTNTEADDATKADGGASPDTAAKPSDDAGTAKNKCADTDGQQACAECCAGEHETGATTYVTSLQKCLCGTDGCATQCADTYCAATPKAPENGSECAKCTQDKKNNCEGPVTSACRADSDCVEFMRCVSEAGCADKT